MGGARFLVCLRPSLALSRTFKPSTREEDDDEGLEGPTHGLKMAASQGIDPPQGSRKAHLMATLGTLDIDPDIRPYYPGPSRDDDPGCECRVGVFCKNIVLKDRKGQMYLVTFQEDKTLDLKRLRKDLGAHRNFSFASGEELFSLLGVETGAVSPFGLMFDSDEKVKFVLDSDLANCQELLNFHPLERTETCLVTIEQLQEFLKYLRRDIHTVNV